MQRCNILVASLFLAALLHIPVWSKSILHVQDGYAGTHAMNYLGSVEGKHYFYEYEPLRTWLEAKAACNASNMRQATITTETQATFLNQITNAPNYTGNYFWTAGRDALRLSQFVWDTIELSVTETGLAFINFYSQQTCLTYISYVTLGQQVSTLCTAPWGTLCEL